MNGIVAGPAGELDASEVSNKAKAIAWDTFRALNCDGWIPKEMDRLLEKARSLEVEGGGRAG